MKSLISVVFLSILGGSYALALMPNASSHQVAQIDGDIDLDDQNQNVIRVSRTTKVLKDGCEVKVSMSSTGVGGVAGAAVGAGAGAVAGSFVPLFGTAMGAFVGGVIGFFTGTAAGAATTLATTDPICAEPLENFLLNSDLNIIEDDDDKPLLNDVKKLNQNLDLTGLIVREKTDISAKIEATATSRYKTSSSVTVKYLIARNLHDTTALLKQWDYTFDYFLNETKRQMDEDVAHFSKEQLRTWSGNKRVTFLSFLMDLQQNIEIISNNYNIKRLYNRVQSLENDLTELRILVENMHKTATCSKRAGRVDSAKSGVDFFGEIAGKFPEVSFFAASAEVVPVVGGILKGVSVLMSGYCYISQNYLD